MAKADYWIKHEVPCPCGDAIVRLGTVDYNKMYAKADPYVCCDCEPCREKYRFDMPTFDSCTVSDKVSKDTVGTICNGQWQPKQ